MGQQHFPLTINYLKALNSPEIANNLENIVADEFSSTLEVNHELNDAITNCLHSAADIGLKVKTTPKSSVHKKLNKNLKQKFELTY